MTIPSLIFTSGGWCSALNVPYAPGIYQPKTAEEYNALKRYAVNPEPLPDEPRATGTGNAPTGAFNVETADRAALEAFAQANDIQFSPAIGDPKLRERIKEHIATAQSTQSVLVTPPQGNQGGSES